MLEFEEDRLTVERLQEGIFKLCGKKINLKEVVDRYLLIYSDELEGEPIPDDIADVLAEPIRAKSFGYKDENGDFYEVCHLYYAGPNPYEMWLKNSDAIENPLGPPTFY